MGKYQVIYADPPWAYRVWSKKGNGRSAESHYPTMSIEEIADLPVKKLADENCALFLWVTFPLLKEIWKVIDAWGFTYKSVAFVWIKQNKKADSLFWGMGYWTRANAEICILATKGSPKRYSKRVHQVIVSHIEEHSKKPEEARRRIEQLMGDVPRIELFARRETPGWDVWGNEVACSLGTEILQENKRRAVLFEKERNNMFLVLGEKPSVAQALAEVLGAKKRADGYLEGEDCIVSWCLGHLAEYAAPEVYDERYKKWEFADLPILPKASNLLENC